MQMRGTIAGVLCGLMLASGGCRVTMPNDPIPGESNAELMSHIAYMPFVTAEAAWRSLYMLQHGQAHEGSYADLTSSMRASGINMPDLSANECPDRAEVAVVLHEVCDLPDGLNYGLTGLGRYALRDLQYERIVRTPRDHGPLTGGEFLGLLARAEEYMQSEGKVDGVQLGEEP